MKTKKVLLSLLFCIFYYASNACECAPSRLIQTYKSSKYVVKVKVVEITDSIQYDLFSNPLNPPYKYGNRPVLKVQKVYKGPLINGTIKLAATNSMCDYYFKLGNEYVIFIDQFQGELVTSVCNNNFELPNNKALREVKTLLHQK
jgi:hypothetical protein